MTRLRSTLLAVTALALTAGSLAAPSAYADAVLTGWNFNLQNTACGASCQAVTNVKLLTLGNGNTVVTQQLSGGSVFGQNFTETGLIGLTGGQFSDGTQFFLGAGAPTGNVPAGDVLYFQLNGLTGKGNADGSLTFNGGTDAVSLYLSPNGPISPTSPTLPAVGTTLLANFNLAPTTVPAGLFSVDSNGVPSGSIGLTLNLDSATSPLGGPLFSLGAQNLDNIVLELANIQPALNQATGGPNPLVAADGLSEQIFLTDQGQVQLTIPEPGTLALFGAALIGIVVLKRRKQATVS